VFKKKQMSRVRGGIRFMLILRGPKIALVQTSNPKVYDSRGRWIGDAREARVTIQEVVQIRLRDLQEILDGSDVDVDSYVAERIIQLLNGVQDVRLDRSEIEIIHRLIPLILADGFHDPHGARLELDDVLVALSVRIAALAQR
jgi:hypothetical protein